MALQMNMEKSKGALKFALMKAGVPNPPKLAVGVALDVSGSYRDEHEDGSTNDILTRLIPWGLVFDDNGEIDLATFSDGKSHAHFVGESLNAKTYQGYVKRNVIGKVPGWCSGTDYSYVLDKFLAHNGWKKDATAQPAPQEKTGMFGGLFGSKKPAPAPVAATVPTVGKDALIVLQTDGDCSREDKARTEALLQEMQDKGYRVYVMFLAYANGSPDFSFLERMADKFSNTGLHVIRNLSEFVNATDDQLNSWLINDELIAWLKK